MDYQTPDLTASLPNYKQPDKLYKILPSDTGKITIEFGRAVFLETITVTQIGSPNVPLVQGVDWTIGSRDATTEASIQATDSTFTKILVTSVTINTRSVAFTVSIGYQCLYPVTLGNVLINDTYVELTPALILDIQNRLSAMESLVTLDETDTLADTEALPVLLSEDLEGLNDDNYVKNEIHAVNTYSNKRVIRPVCGGFYTNGLILARKSNGVQLVKDVDYIVYDCDRGRTSITSNTSGVHRLIRIVADLQDQISVSYRAFGGEVTYNDMKALNSTVSAIYAYLKEKVFLTTESLGQIPSYLEMQQRIVSLEDDVRQLQAETPTYGDSSFYVAKSHRLKTTNTNLNWYTIAKLYTVAGTTTPVVADRMHFRMSLVNSGIMADVFAGFNLTNSDNPFTLDVVGVNMAKGYVPMTNYAGLSNIVRPQFRVIYNNTVGTGSGVFLQIGLALPTMEETLGLENLSGKESCWIFTEPGATNTAPANTAVTLPNNSYIWDSANPDSKQFVKQMSRPEGWLVYGGSLPVAGMVNVADFSITTILGTVFDLKSIKKIRMEFYDGAELREIEGFYDATTGIAKFVFVENNEHLYFSAKVVKTTTTNIIMNVTGTVPETFNLIHIFFDV